MSSCLRRCQQMLMGEENVTIIKNKSIGIFSTAKKLGQIVESAGVPFRLVSLWVTEPISIPTGKKFEKASASFFIYVKLFLAQRLEGSEFWKTGSAMNLSIRKAKREKGKKTFFSASLTYIMMRRKIKNWSFFTRLFIASGFLFSAMMLKRNSISMVSPYNLLHDSSEKNLRFICNLVTLCPSTYSFIISYINWWLMS